MSTARHGDVEIEYETVGTIGEPLLVVLGTGVQMPMLHDEFCAVLVDHGFRVARFDNRDAGRSTHFSTAGKPSPWTLLTRPASAAGYGLADMADDAVAVLDAVGWGQAHIVGISQGGMIAQKVATRHPSRILTLTSISATPSARIGRPTIATLLALLRSTRLRITSPETFARHLVELQTVLSSGTYPVDEAWLREVGAECYNRSYDQAGVQRQSAAFQAGGDRRAELAALRLPTLVVHGEQDRIIRPVGGEATAAAIPGSRLVTYPGMGHELPRPLWPAIAGEIRATAKQRPASSLEPR
jgi:pimeloyl-ACP methyl ester carboxylesterase